jgi:FAD/FMN-containing dehydrogenase
VGLERTLADVVGPSHVLTDPDVTTPYGSDWTGLFKTTPRAVVRPASTDEVAGTVTACAAHGVALVPQGGNTGLTGGSVPVDESIVVSLSRLRSISEIETGWDQVIAQAGAPLAEIQKKAHAAGYFLPIDHSARDQATVGGSVATNAGGALAWRFGMTRSQVVGMEAILANGTIVRRLSPLIKNNTGYDLSQLLIGSEGTLGIVTQVRFRLLPELGPPTTVLIGVKAFTSALDLFASARDSSTLVAAEFLSDACMWAVRKRMHLPHPLGADHPYYVLLEFAGTDTSNEIADALSGIPERSTIVSQSEDQRRRLWTYRESLNETVTALGGPRKFDIAVPRDRLSEFLDAIDSKFTQTGITVFAFGHLGDGNVHLNILGGPRNGPPDQVVYETVAGLGGTISAEHGIGRMKREWLHLSRTPEEIAAMKAIKRALDPDNLMNPGVLLPDGGRDQG